MFQGEPQYKLAPVPVEGKYGCAIMQTINGKPIPSTARADTADAALQGGLEDLRNLGEHFQPTDAPGRHEVDPAVPQEAADRDDDDRADLGDR